MKFSIDDNTTLPEDYVRNIKKEYSGVFYERFIKGLWVLAEGIIYPMYAQAIEPTPTDQPSDYRLSIDYGTMNAFAALLWEKHGNVWYAAREYYYSGRETGVTKTDQDYANDLKVFIKEIMEERQQAVKTGMAEYMRKMKVIIDPSAASFKVAVQRAGFRVKDADNEVNDGIRVTAMMMSKGKLKINRSCQNLIDELRGYVWDETAARRGEEKPVKIRDHGCDALRYQIKTIIPKWRLTA